MWPLHDRQRAHTITQKTRDLCRVSPAPGWAGESFYHSMQANVSGLDRCQHRLRLQVAWVLATRVVVLPLGAGLVEDEEGPHVCSALQGLSSAVVTASKVQASKMPWDPHARPQSLFCTSD